MLTSLSRLQSIRVAGTCAALAVVCLGAFQFLELQITAASDRSYNGDRTILDKRFGYTADEIASLLEAWGSRGRQLYTIIEAIDVFLYFPAYGGLFIVLLNILGGTVMRRGYHPVVRKAYLLVVMIVAVDLVEDALQVGLVNTYHAGGLQDEQWLSMVQAASTANQIKWWLVRSGLAIVACLLLALVKK